MTSKLGTCPICMSLCAACLALGLLVYGLGENLELLPVAAAGLAGAAIFGPLLLLHLDLLPGPPEDPGPARAPHPAPPGRPRRAAQQLLRTLGLASAARAAILANTILTNCALTALSVIGAKGREAR